MLIKSKSKITQNNTKTHIIFDRVNEIYNHFTEVVSWILFSLYTPLGNLRPPVTHYSTHKLITVEQGTENGGA